MARYYRDSRGALRIEYTPEEKLRIERYRWRLKLRMARESLIHAQERYADLKAAYYETLRREDEDVN